MRSILNIILNRIDLRISTLLLGGIASQFINLVTAMLLGFWFAPEIVGHFSTTFYAALLTSCILTLRSEYYIVKTRDDFRMKQTGVTLTLILFIFSFILPLSFILVTEYSLYAILILGVMLSLINTFTFLKTAENNFKIISISRVVYLLLFLSLVCLIKLTGFENTASSLIYSYVVSLLCGVFLLKSKFQIFHSLDFGGAISFIKERFTRLLSLTLTSGIDHAKELIVVLALSAFFDPRLSGAYFMLAKVINAPVQLLASSVGQVMYRDVNNEILKGVPIHVKTRKSFEKYWLLGGSCIAILTSIIYLIIQLINLGEWSVLKELILPMSIIGLFTFIASSSSVILIAIGLETKGMIFALINLLGTGFPFLLGGVFSFELDTVLYLWVLITISIQVVYVLFLMNKLGDFDEKLLTSNS